MLYSNETVSPQFTTKINQGFGFVRNGMTKNHLSANNGKSQFIALKKPRQKFENTVVGMISRSCVFDHLVSQEVLVTHATSHAGADELY